MKQSSLISRLANAARATGKHVKIEKAFDVPDAILFQVDDQIAFTLNILGVRFRKVLSLLYSFIF